MAGWIEINEMKS